MGETCVSWRECNFGNCFFMRYTATWDNPIPMEFGEVTIMLPDMPDERFIKNYYKATKDQKYEREVLSPDAANWGYDKLDQFAADQWHRRRNGEWVFIKGVPYYIPGPATVFFDWWTKQTGGKPDFRLSALELAWYWYLYIEKDPRLYGCYDMKPRRIGDTEWWLFVTWERTTRQHGRRAGLQSFTDDEAEKNFKRLAKGHENMPYFFKPKHTGTTSKYLAFQSPKELMTMKKFMESKEKIDIGGDDMNFLDSFIDFEATVEGKYDGDLLHTWFQDEIFKILPHKMDVKKQWNNIKRVMSLFASTKIIGKAILCSTIEEKNQKDNPDYAMTVEIARYFWEKSNPNERDANGETYTGLARVFRDFTLAGEPDEYGFPKVNEVSRHRKNRLDKYMEAQDWDNITDIFRKEPSTPEEALNDFSAACPLNPRELQIRSYQIRNGLDFRGIEIENYSPKCREYMLVWKNGIPFTEVEAVPSKDGLWHISQMPVRPNNVGSRSIGGISYPVPLSRLSYSAGVDPYDSSNPIKKGSDLGLVIKRTFDPLAEKGLVYDEKTGDVLNPENMITNRPVCDYKGRPKNPIDAYMDVVKTLWFYGCPALLEIDKASIETWMLNNNLVFFMEMEPDSLMPKSRRRKRQNLKASQAVISRFTDLLVTYTAKYWMCIDHPRLLDQAQRFTVQKRTYFDLITAWGYCEIMDDDKIVKNPKESSDSDGWTTQEVYETVPA